ncbi:MAG: hypothetical protein ACJ72N_27550 [Labedaea sp.]
MTGSTDIEDPFALADDAGVGAPDPNAVISGGRYRLPRRDGSHKPYGWQRVSNLVSAYSDQFGLRMWELGEVLQGVAMREELYANLLYADLPKMTREERKAWVERFIEHAKEASGGNAGSNHGSMRHESVEALHAGLGYAHRDAGTRRALVLYQETLKRHQLVALPDMQERIVLVEELEACGRIDNILQDAAGIFRVADLKTQRRFWTWLEIKAQQACYNHAVAMWDPAAGCWVDMPPVSQETALILWMPRQPDDPEALAAWEPHVDVWEVDTVEGWETAKRAHEVVKDRARAKNAKNPGAWLRPAPPVTDLERYAGRFAAVDTIAEGSQLVQEARDAGVWCEALAATARQAYERVTVPA